MTGDYRTPAVSSYNVAASPYWGVDGIYSSSSDPWRNNENRQFMQRYYQLTTEYAQKGGVNYPVSSDEAISAGHTCSSCKSRSSSYVAQVQTRLHSHVC